MFVSKLILMTENFSLKKIIISGFVLLNLFAILISNSPDFILKSTNKALDKYSFPYLNYNIRYFVWFIKQYAYIVGLNNKWQMFGKLHRFNWKHVISARYGNYKKVLLPVPGQVKRNFFHKEFIDFKEGKFALNLYSNETGRQAYAHYLCRNYPVKDNVPISSIIFELSYQYILDPPQARLYGRHFDLNTYTKLLNDFQCPQGRSSL